MTCASADHGDPCERPERCPLGCGARDIPYRVDYTTPGWVRPTNEED